MEIISCLSFWITAFLLVIFSLLTVFLPKMSFSVLFGFLTFLFFSFLYFQLSAPFNGVVQIIIYAVTMSILFAFGIMLTNFPKDEKKYLFISPRLLLTIIGLVLIAFAVVGIINQDMSFGLKEFLLIGSNNITDSSLSIQILGHTLFTRQVFAFEILSVLLLTGVVGIFILVTKTEKEGE